MSTNKEQNNIIHLGEEPSLGKTKKPKRKSGKTRTYPSRTNSEIHNKTQTPLRGQENPVWSALCLSAQISTLASPSLLLIFPGQPRSSPPIFIEWFSFSRTALGILFLM